MLTESFVASTLNAERASNVVATGIHLHDFQPLPALKSSFKKSSTNANCLAISPTHIFAAQADKAVVNVYSRGNNNQEAVVPFPEKIHSIALAGESDGAGTLVLGTEGGRVILWELGTGRQVSTPQNHLQATTCLAVDPTANFLLSGSTDSTINVWSIPGLLSFSSSSANDYIEGSILGPLRSLSSHRAAITAVVFGHSASANNIAVSASKDNTCVVWDYHSGEALHTFLLSHSPLCLALDPADRAAYAGYDDGTIQFLDFYNQGGLNQTLYDPVALLAPTQPPASTIWAAQDHPPTAILCLQISYEGTRLLSGHRDGKVHTWDVGTGKFEKHLVDFSAPVTNLQMLKPTGFANVPEPALKLQNVVKPRYESFTNGHYSGGTTIPPKYTLTAQFTSNLPLPGSSGTSLFHEALNHPSFPTPLLEEVHSEFSIWRNGMTKGEDSADVAELRAQNAGLSSRLASAIERERSALAEIQKRDKEGWERQRDDEIKAAKKKRRRLRRLQLAEVARKKEMGEVVEDEDISIDAGVEEEGDLSSSTDEMLQSD